MIFTHGTFPELKLRVGNKTPNVMFQDISTSFEPITLVRSQVTYTSNDDRR